MLDVKLILEKPDYVKDMLKNKKRKTIIFVCIVIIIIIFLIFSTIFALLNINNTNKIKAKTFIITNHLIYIIFNLKSIKLDIIYKVIAIKK